MKVKTDTELEMSALETQVRKLRAANKNQGVQAISAKSITG